MDLQIRQHKDQPRPDSPETCYQQFLGAESETSKSDNCQKLEYKWYHIISFCG